MESPSNCGQSLSSQVNGYEANLSSELHQKCAVRREAAQRSATKSVKRRQLFEDKIGSSNTESLGLHSTSDESDSNCSVGIARPQSVGLSCSNRPVKISSGLPSGRKRNRQTGSESDEEVFVRPHSELHRSPSPAYGSDCSVLSGDLDIKPSIWDDDQMHVHRRDPSFLSGETSMTVSEMNSPQSSVDHSGIAASAALLVQPICLPLPDQSVFVEETYDSTSMFNLADVVLRSSSSRKPRAIDCISSPTRSQNIAASVDCPRTPPSSSSFAASAIKKYHAPYTCSAATRSALSCKSMGSLDGDKGNSAAVIAGNEFVERRARSQSEGDLSPIGRRRSRSVSNTMPLLDDPSATCKVLLQTAATSIDDTGVMLISPAIMPLEKEFVNVKFLGGGTFADVFVGVLSADYVGKRQDIPKYAIKKLLQRITSTRRRDFLLKEANMMIKILQERDKHCFVIHFYRAWQEDNHLYMQLEYAAGGSLEDWIEQTHNLAGSVFPITVESLLQVAHNVAAGLRQIHAARIVHLDIKPANLLVCSPGYVKIGDFGSAMSFGHGDLGDEGDSRYMAKELLSITARSSSADMFSFGITLFELYCVAMVDLTRDTIFEQNLPPPKGPHLPFSGKGWHVLRQQNVNEIIARYVKNDILCHIIQTCMHEQYSSRPSAEAIMAIPEVCAAGSGINTSFVELCKLGPMFRESLIGNRGTIAPEAIVSFGLDSSMDSDGMGDISIMRDH